MIEYSLNNDVTLKGNVLCLQNCEIFECNNDALLLITEMINFKLQNLAFTRNDLMSKLNLDEITDNIFCLENVISHLKGCFILYENE